MPKQKTRVTIVAMEDESIMDTEEISIMMRFPSQSNLDAALDGAEEAMSDFIAGPEAPYFPRTSYSSSRDGKLVVAQTVMEWEK